MNGGNDTMDAFLQLADGIKKDVSKILRTALRSFENEYRTEGGYIKWGLVEKKIHQKIDYHLTEAPPDKE